MENRLKERLTGAAILVALIVLLVPEMFHGQRSDVATNAGSSGEGPPVRSYTIDLSNGPARTAPLQSTPAASAPGAAETTPEPVPTPTPAPVSGSASGPGAQATARPASPATTAATTAAATAAVTATTAATPTTMPAAAPSASLAAAKAASAAAGSHANAGGWSVQLGTFAQHDNAERLARTAQSKGFTISVSERDAKGLYHVHAGGLADRAAAQALQQRLRDQGLAAAVVAPQPGASKTQQ